MRATPIVLGTALVLVTVFGEPTIAWADGDRAKLNSFNSNPVLVDSGRGSFSIKLKRNPRRLEYRLTYTDLPEVLQAHIHLGNAWENGGIVAFLCANGDVPAPRPAGSIVPPCPDPKGTVVGTIEPDDVIGPVGDFETLRKAIDADATYVNVHTISHPPGQIRGTID